MNKSFQRFLFIFMCSALLISVVLNVVIYRRADLYYRERNRVQLEPLGLDSYPADAEPRPVRDGRTRVVFLGDSRAFTWPPPDLAAVEFINRGIGSQTTGQVLGRFDAHVAPLTPDIVVVQVGINDLKTIPLFPQERDAIVAKAQENIAAIVRKSQDLGATVIVTTIFPHGEVPWQRRFVWSPDVARAIIEVNDSLATLADERIFVLDAASILADQTGFVRREYQVDLLHINRAGYDALNERLIELLVSN